MNSEKYFYWISRHTEDPAVFYDEFCDALYNFEVDLEGFISSVKVIDYLTKSTNRSLDDVSGSNLDSASSEEESQIFELIAACKEIIEESEELQSELATRKLVSLREETEDWFEEIIVFIAEKSIIPVDTVQWFLRRNINPFAFDGDLFNGSRTGRSGLAINESTPVDILRELSNDSNWEILWRLALNPVSPPDLLNQLILFEDEMSDVIRACVAMNNNCALSTLSSLVESSSPDLRTLASRNPNATDELLLRANELGLTDRPFKNWGSSFSWLLHR